MSKEELIMNENTDLCTNYVELLREAVRKQLLGRVYGLHLASSLS